MEPRASRAATSASAGRYSALLALFAGTVVVALLYLQLTELAQDPESASARFRSREV